MEKATKNTQKVNYDLFARKTVEHVFETFHTSKKGLSEKQADIAREQYGDNTISYGKKTPFILEVLKAYITPFTLVLIGLGLTSITTDVIMAAPADRDYFGSAIIFTMVIISGTMTLIQSVRSNHAAEKLKSLVIVTATVRRKNQFLELPIE
ncbi:MAG: cation-transporting P-type ATPase, partial [Enterococcus sp.]